MELTTVRRPYADGYMIAAQVLSIIAFLMSWIWWVTFIIGLVCMVVLQCIWCCRQKGAKVLNVTMAFSAVAGIYCVMAGILMLVLWKDRKYCSIFIMNNDYSYAFGKKDLCKEGYWAFVAFFDAVLWFTTSGCIYSFVKSGRHAAWEQKLRAVDETTEETETATNIEMGIVPPTSAATTATTNSTPVVGIATTAPVGETRGLAAEAVVSASTNAEIDDVA